MASTGQTSTTVNCPVCGTSHVPVSSCANGVQAATCVSCGHFFKFRAVEPLKSTITLTVNGKQYTVGNEYGPSSALNGFLRDQRISVGTKHMCYQGGCGTCLVEAKLLTEFYGDTLTKKQVEDSFDGVICRCTGYRPILAAFKNMAKGRSKCSSSTDFKTKVCKKSGKSCSGRCSSVSEPLTHLVFADSQWFRPNTEQQITDILNANKGKKIRFLLGNTAHGVYSDQSPDNYDVIMDLTSFREMYDISFDTDIVLGGGLTLTMLVDIFTRMTQEAPYFGECANLLKRIANLPVRNRATWSGNLMLKYVHRDFPSDILVLLQVLRARIWTDFDGNDVSISDFLSTDLTGKLVFMFSYTELDDVDHIKFYKVTPRVQNAHCYVTGGFRVRMDKGSFVLKETPVIAYSGIGAQFDRAIKTEAYLNGKNIADATVLKTALSTLAGEIKADSSPFVLNLVGVEAGLPYRSGASELYWTRPISSGVQTYDTVPVEYPVTQPLKKLEANAQMLASQKVEYCGQPVAIVLAVLSLDDAIQQKSFFPKQCDDLVVGDPDGAIAQSAKKLSGTISMGHQYHFHMETQASVCVPKEDGMDVYTTTQWIDFAQSSISQVTGMLKSSINVQVKRLGGAYGAKITQNNWIAAACAYACNNWSIDCVAVKTNTPANTAARSPGSLPAIFIMETIMEHVAKTVDKDPTDVRILNLFSNGAVAIFWPDGTIAITHGGIELGQGVNTKVKATNSNTTANSITTGGSITSENVCAGVIECCKVLNARLAPVKAKLPDPTWPNVIEKCYQDGIDLTSRYWRNPAQSTPFQYYSYGATVTEVDFDVLTGEHTIARVDILFDCGQSTNPALDVGQVEGAFVMGLGYWLTEQLRFDPETGALVTDSTWEYKPPSSKDIPVDFRVNLVKKNPNPAGILGAKAVGEPPLCMSCSALFAIKHAIQAARKDIGKDDTYFPLNGPATPELCQLACLTDPSQFALTVTR
ncbi:XDH-like protein [Mya arenaria]|uniref:XDH-like protein n=1 Tax=Mya arenaria TaxID=6604 RepID=A0ABY7DZE8_MYAAR|nr:XDH-like protein [Mya arenaria]